MDGSETRADRNLDTVEQKPSQIGAEAPENHRDVRADLDNKNPTPGAQPPSDAEKVTLKQPHKSGAKAVASETTKKHITPEFFRQHPIADLQQQTDFWLEKQGRLVHPMFKPAGATHYEPIDWQEAFALIARELNALATPDAAIF